MGRGDELGNKRGSFFFVLVEETKQVMVIEEARREDRGYVFFRLPGQPGFQDIPADPGRDVIYDHGLVFGWAESSRKTGQ